MSLRDDFAEAAVEAGGFFDDLKNLARAKLTELDAHPVGHIGMEMVRAKVQKRTIGLNELFSMVDEAVIKERAASSQDGAKK